MTRRATTLLAVCAIVVAGAAAYFNSLGDAFVFDDDAIRQDIALHHLWPVGPILRGPRPVVDLTFAANYSLGRLDVTGYHVVNLAIHILAALTLFGIVRRMLSSERLRTRFGEAADPLALVIALLWLVHPLQTESVTYIIQRSESLMGLLYLLTLYCALRGFSSPRTATSETCFDRENAKTRKVKNGTGSGPFRNPSFALSRFRGLNWWFVAAVAACAIGVGVKPVIASAPLIVLLADRLFISRSFGESLRKSRLLYIGLAATWLLLGLLLWHCPPGKEVGFHTSSFTVGRYAMTELGVVARYLRLSLWPAPLVLDYRWLPATSFQQVLAPAILIFALLAATLWALWRRSPLAFPGLWFFIILLPTSSFLPIADPYFEHRMYLSLAAVVAAVVLAVYWAGRWLLRRMVARDETRLIVGGAAGLLLALLAVIVLSYATWRRNLDYSTPTAIWTDVAHKRPDSMRAHLNLAKALAAERQFDDARRELVEAARLSPNDAQVCYAMGNLQMGAFGNFQEAAADLRRAIALDPSLVEAHYNLAMALTALEKIPEAISEYRLALKLDPDNAQSHSNIALLLVRQGRVAEAVGHYQQALRLAPDAPLILMNFAWLRATCAEAAFRNADEALRLAETACREAGPQDVRALDTLAAAQAEAGRFQEAAATAERAQTMAQLAGQKELATRIARCAELYRSGRPYREPPAVTPGAKAP